MVTKVVEDEDEVVADMEARSGATEERTEASGSVEGARAAAEDSNAAAACPQRTATRHCAATSMTFPWKAGPIQRSLYRRPI